MDYRDLTNLLLKVAGAVIVAYTIVQAPVYLAYDPPSGYDSLWFIIGAIVLPTLMPLILGFIFLLAPHKVTNRLIAHNGVHRGKMPDIRAMESIAFSTLGLYLLFRVVSDLIYHATSVFVALRSHESFDYGVPGLLPYNMIIATLAELVFAVYLLVGAKGLVRLIGRLREAGRG